MPVLPQQPLRAPTGLDVTSDTGVVDPTRAPLLQNVLCDQPGYLRTNISYKTLFAAPLAAPVDAVGFYYGDRSIPLDPSNEPATDQILYVTNGSLYKMVPTPGVPVPGTSSGTLVGGIANPFTPGVNVHFVEFNDELIL